MEDVLEILVVVVGGVEEGDELAGGGGGVQWWRNLIAGWQRGLFLLQLRHGSIHHLQLVLETMQVLKLLGDANLFFRSAGHTIHRNEILRVQAVKPRLVFQRLLDLTKRGGHILLRHVFRQRQ